MRKHSKLCPIKDVIDEVVAEDGADRDELILAAILSAAHTTGREIRPHNSREGVPGSSNFFGIESGPCCAVGAGVLYSGITVTYPITSFAEAYGVTRLYAIGVSHGFEYASAPAVGTDYGRGRQVGDAVFSALYDAEDDR